VLHPALTVNLADADLVLAIADDYSPSAAESNDDSITLYFRQADARDAARVAIMQAFPGASVDVRNVDDEDWARRSQQDLEPVAVGRLTVFPSLESRDAARSASTRQLSLVIQPSMGFGTGHHATTRLCLRALQSEPLAGRTVLDVGTGSGVLAMAAVRLGAAGATGIDNDPDAIESARENLSLNLDIQGVTFAVADLEDWSSTADVVTANLTGALLVREAGRLLALLAPGGRLIVSGLLAGERDDVVAALSPARILWESEEDGWVGLSLVPANVRPSIPV
jgi:ribosomal protein L11 methyltransferase